jgi:nucleotide-binding universal stress UspA family protein
MTELAAAPAKDTYMTVLVPLDGSHLAAAALPHAVALAKRFGAPLMLLHVLPEGSTSMPERSLEQQALRAQLEAYLAGLKRSLDRCDVAVLSRIEVGSAARTIAQVARGLERPVVVMSRAGRTATMPGHEKESFGTVAEEVVREWTGPLLLIRPYA